MNVATRFVLLNAVCLCLASTVLAQHGTGMDIVMEGPWVLYRRVLPNVDGQSVSVLIAMAPGGVTGQTSDDPMMFHQLTVSAGSGYPIAAPGIYCIAFDGMCGGSVSA